MSIFSESDGNITNNEVLEDNDNIFVEKIKYNDEEEILSQNSETSQTHNQIEKSSSKASDNEDNVVEIEDIAHNEDEVDKMHELLFCVQCIGKFIDDKRNVYEKNEYCEPSMRDIHRFLRKDDPENPKCKFLILNWKVIENDIIPLIINYENNEKIQQLGLVLLVDLTEKLPELMENRNSFENLLTELHQVIVDSKLIERIAANLAESTAKLRESSIMRSELKDCENNLINEEEKVKMMEVRKKIADIENKSHQMIELIFVFLKQIMNIFSMNNMQKNIQNNLKLIKKFSSLKIFDAIVFHSQSFENEFGKRIVGNMLELIFSIIRPFTPSKIYDLLMNKEGNMTHLQKLREDEKFQRQMRKSQYSTRPNNFGTTIKINRPLDNTSFIVSNVNQLMNNPQQVINEKLDVHNNQRQKPKKALKNKKVNNKFEEEIILINDLKIEENSYLDITHLELIFSLRKFCNDFLKYSFNNYVKFFIIQISRLSEELDKYDIYHFISLLTFFLDYHRYTQHYNINEAKKNMSKIDFNAEEIREAFMPEVLDFIYKYNNIM